MSEGRELLLSEEQQYNLAMRLVQQDYFGIKEDPKDYIVLKSGRMSPHYLDIRPGISDFDTRYRVVATSMLYLATYRANNRGYDSVQEAYQQLAGTPEAFTSYTTSVADLAKMGVLQPRVDLNKKTGNKTPILGRYVIGSQIAEFDDVVTDGQSKIETINLLTAAGLVISDYFVVLDREEGGAAQVKAETGLDITPALGLSSMVMMLHRDGVFNTTQYDNVRRYIDEYGDQHAKERFAAV